MYVDVYVLYIRSRMCTLSCTYRRRTYVTYVYIYIYVYIDRCICIQGGGRGDWIHGERISGGIGRKATPDSGSSRERWYQGGWGRLLIRPPNRIYDATRRTESRGVRDVQVFFWIKFSSLSPTSMKYREFEFMDLHITPPMHRME